MVDSSSNLSAPAPHPISWDSSPKNSNKNTRIETQTNAKNHWFPIFIFIFVWGFFWSNAIFLAFQTILLTYYLFLIPPPQTRRPRILGHFRAKHLTGDCAKLLNLLLPHPLSSCLLASVESPWRMIRWLIDSCELSVFVKSRTYLWQKVGFVKGFCFLPISVLIIRKFLLDETIWSIPYPHHHLGGCFSIGPMAIFSRGCGP